MCLFMTLLKTEHWQYITMFRLIILTRGTGAIKDRKLWNAPKTPVWNLPQVNRFTGYRWWFHERCSCSALRTGQGSLCRWNKRWGSGTLGKAVVCKHSSFANDCILFSLMDSLSASYFEIWFVGLSCLMTTTFFRGTYGAVLHLLRFDEQG